jgi:hypothetical protein
MRELFVPAPTTPSARMADCATYCRRRRVHRETKIEKRSITHLRVGVVAQARQLVDDGVLRVGAAHERQRERHGSSHADVAVVQQMIKGA